MKSEFKNGELFEIITATVHSALKDREDVVIKQNIKIQDCDGLDSQVDVYIQSILNGYPCNTIIECKDHSRPIEVGTMRDFIEKASSLGAQQKIFVAKNGFQKAAKVKAQKAGVVLSTLKECTDSQVRDWIGGAPMVRYTNKHKHLSNIRISLDNVRIDEKNTARAIYIVSGKIVGQDIFSGILVESVSDALFEGMVDGDRKVEEILFNINPGEIIVKINGSCFDVKGIIATLVLTVETTNRMLHPWKYQGEISPTVSVAAGEFQFKDHAACISMAKKQGADQCAFSIKTKPRSQIGIKYHSIKTDFQTTTVEK